MRCGAVKSTSINEAIARFPDQATWFRRKKDDGRAEAALIALYGHNIQQIQEATKNVA